MEKQHIVETFLERGFLPAPDVVDHGIDPSFFSTLYDKIISPEKPIVLCRDILEGIRSNEVCDINWNDFEESRVLHEKKKNTKMYAVFLNILNHSHPLYKGRIQQLIQDAAIDPVQEPLPQRPSEPPSSPVLEPPQPRLDSRLIVLKNYEAESKKREVKDFALYFRARYDLLSSFLKARAELQGTLAIGHLAKKIETEHVSLIGMVYDIATTKNGNCLITLEDPSGRTKVLLNKDGPLKDIIPYLTYDEVIGVQGIWRNNMVFASLVLFPDIPVNRPVKKAPEEVYAVFVSDIHVGSKMFLEGAFLRFISWLNGECGTEHQKEIARKVKYVFAVGDCVDGVGIYPSQEQELLLTNIHDQYARLAELFSMIRKDLPIIMCAGNHDACRLSEPQPRYFSYVKPVSDLPNVTMVSNPSLVNLHSSEDFEGITCLLYHGYGYDYYVSNIAPLREGGGYNRTDLVMKFMLQKRHLSPTHTSTLYIPTPNQDSLVIEKVPDVFVSGHVHKSSISFYRGTNLIVTSCWQNTTSFQEKLGHTPDPGRVPVLNLRTREVTMLDFHSDPTSIREEEHGMGREL